MIIEFMELFQAGFYFGLGAFSAYALGTFLIEFAGSFCKIKF